MLALPVDQPALTLRLDTTVTEMSLSESPATGGMLLSLSAGGLEPTFLASQRVLHAFAGTSADPSTTRTSPAGNPDVGLRYWGLAFDVHAVRGIRVRALDFVARVAGAQRVWIYVRSRKQCGAGKDCSLWGHELSANAWELVGPNATVGQEVTVDASLLATVEVGEIALAAGETRGFLLVGSLGVAYATVGDGGRTCDAGFLQRCTLFSDSFAEIYPGKLVLTQALIPAPAPNVLLAAEGNERSPFFYTGTVHYDNDEIVGATYVCRFETTSSDGTVNVAESLPTRAFTAALTDLNVATNFSCIVPAWPFNEAVTNFSVVSTGSPVWFGAAITGSVDRTMTNFRFSAIYTALASHMWATAAGGDNIGITGAGFQTATAAYECEFSALDGSHSASTLVTHTCKGSSPLTTS